MATLTVSGNEITDAVRTTGTQGDGRTPPDSSTGIWEAMTNLVTNGGFETNATGWTPVGSTVTRVTSQAKFGSASGEIVTDGAAATEGAYHDFTATAAVHTVSAWVRGAAGGTVRMAVRDNAGANAQTGTAVTLTTTWQRITLTTSALTAATWRCYVETNAQQAITFQVDGGQAELGPCATPYVETNGGTAARAAARVRMPSALITEAQGWVAIRIRTGWGTSAIPSFPIAFAWESADYANYFEIVRATSTKWRFEGARNSTANVLDVTDAGFTAGSFVTLIARWTSSTWAFSRNGAAFSSMTRGGTAGGTSLPATFDVGARSNGGPTLHLDSDVLWFACGTGTLTDADAALIHALGNTDHPPETFPGACTAVWYADTAFYEDERFTVLNETNLPHVRVDIDFDNDPSSTTRTWTDVTAYVKRLSTRRGRRHELDRVDTGTLTATLLNTDRRFDPSYTSGPYYPNVKPMRRIRARARWGTVTYNLFHGYILGWPQAWPDGGMNAIVDLRAVDAFAVLAQYDLVGKSYGTALAGTRIGTALSDAGFGTAERSLDAGQSSIVASGTLSTSAALSHLLDVQVSENGLLFVDGGGTWIFQDRHHRIKNEVTAGGTLGDTAGEIPYRELSTSNDASEIWNRIMVTPSGGTAEEAIDSSSTASYYTRTLSRDYLISSQNEAYDAAHWNLARYKEPALRTPAVQIVCAAATALWPNVLAREISDRVLLHRRPPGGGTISEFQHVESIGHEIALESDWLTEWLLSPVDPQSYWVLEDSVNGVLDDTTKLGY